jgi:hypothetical protein
VSNNPDPVNAVALITGVDLVAWQAVHGRVEQSDMPIYEGSAFA